MALALVDPDIGDRISGSGDEIEYQSFEEYEVGNAADDEDVHYNPQEGAVDEREGRSGDRGDQRDRAGGAIAYGDRDLYEAISSRRSPTLLIMTPALQTNPDPTIEGWIETRWTSMAREMWTVRQL